MDNNKYAILILAAGSSERLGSPKQLVEWKQTTLLNHVIQQALEARNSDVFVALGGNKAKIRSSIPSTIPIIHISNWKEGMGETISSGLSQIELDSYEAIILSVCDQPHISGNIFNSLISKLESGNTSIVISKYNDSSGPPTLFYKTHYNELLQLTGDNGGKNIVKIHMDNVSSIDFKDGNIDIDTEEDLKNLSSFK